MKRFLFLIFLYTPEKVMHILLSIIGYLRSFWRVLQHLSLDVEIYTGYYNGKPVTVGWIGTDEMKDYILKLLYNEKAQITKLSSTSLIKLQNTINELSDRCDLIYVERFSILPQLKNFKRIKPIVNTLMEVNALSEIDSAHSTQKRRRRDRETKKLIAESNITYKNFNVAHHPEKLRFFYDQLYAPHISTTHGNSNVDPFEWMNIFYAKGFLRLAYENQKVISGALFLKNKNTLIWCKYGVSDASNKLYRASNSIHMHLQYAKELRLQYYSAFHTKPFLNNGSFRYKRECGLGILRESRNYYHDRDLYVKVINYRQGVVEFLMDNPFIFEENGKLCASLLCTDDSKEMKDQILEQYKRYHSVGIDQYQFHIARELTPSEKELIYQKCGLTGDKHRLAFLTYRAEK